MKTYLIAWVRRLLAWLEATGPVRTSVFTAPALAPQTPSSPWAIRERARALTVAAETYAGNGEHKRHQVYAQLIKEFPTARKRDLGMAIEQGLQ